MVLLLETLPSRILVLLFAICFAVQVVDLGVKYLSGETTMTHTLVADPQLRFPDILFCPRPGYKAGRKTKSKSWSAVSDGLCGGTEDEAAHLWARPHENDSELERLFLESTYSPREIVAGYRLFIGGRRVTNEDVEVSEMSSHTYGRCSVLRVNATIASGMYLRVDVEFPDGVESVMLFLRGSSQHVILGVMLDFLSGSYESVKLKPKTTTKVAVEKSKEEYLPEKTQCLDYSTSYQARYSWFDCIVTTSRAKLAEQDRTSPLCYWPPLEFFIPANSTAKACTSPSEGHRMHRAISWAVGQASNVCVRDCRKESFKIFEHVRPRPGIDCRRTKVGLFMSDSLVRHGKQRIIYDLNDVVNGVGGSMGLFLGTSFMSIMFYIYAAMRKRLAFGKT